MKKLSQIISWVFNPLIVPVYTLGLLFTILTLNRNSLDIKDNLFLINPILKWVFLGLFFLLIFLAPGISLLILKRNKQIESIELNNRKERGWPILITGFYSLILAYILFRQLSPKYFPIFFHALAVLGIISAIVAYLLTRIYKISMHAMGMGLACGIILFDYIHFFIPSLFPLLSVILISGVVMSARYILQKHTLFELVSGYLLGITLSVGILLLIFKFL